MRRNVCRHATSRLRMDTIKEFIGGDNIFILYFLVRYFIYAALLVIIYILYTQKWAGGFTEPPATTRTWIFTIIYTE